MNKEWWEEPACWVCDFWWGFLAVVALGLSTYFSRAYWLPDPVSLCFSEDTNRAVSEAIPWTLRGADILFAFDQSGSMAPLIDGARANASQLMQHISARVGDQRFGVAGFSDYTDIPYALYQPLTSDVDAVQSAINSLALMDGGDTPEAYSRMMFESYSDPAIDWLDQTGRFLIIFGDSYPHDPDAGRDGIPDTEDDLRLEETLTQLKTQKITLIFVSSPVVYSDSGLIDRWETWTNVGGGTVVRCGIP